MTAYGPEMAKSPLELISRDAIMQPSVIEDYWGSTVCGGLAFLGVVLANYATKRPVMSGIQKHILLTSAGAALGHYIYDKRREYLAGRDAVLRYYVETHPDDFPPYERQKYADFLGPWVPIR